ncbi:hydroxyisourate hydrolase [Pukyongiella litopenaei]|uniref:5-hydroxyisourate hydrolase n=1 Tax=Pukyongiella litopenaei TaxID=2605946 RepID=A0A2S0MS97_9RHOB|nr:hydroxyisourate hydrolase [Pukyongiella litopenaei]AVO38687.1 hydroxyisourate hydrolase [Pukyongiella litopenaei]
MTGYLTTHVLDTARGCPAEGLRIELFRIEGSDRTLLKTLATNDDGRTDEQILPEAEFATGEYELVFHAGAYLDATGTPPEDPRFLDIIPIRFGMSEPLHYHVPLLLSPFGYSTYRGS